MRFLSDFLRGTLPSQRPDGQTTSAPTTDPTRTRSGKRPLFIAVAVFGVVVLVVALSSRKPSSGRAAVSTVPVQDAIKAQLEATFPQSAQQIFDTIHPIGTATGVAVHDVSIDSWKRGQNTNRYEDIQRLTVRYTLYWKGPFTKDGFTKISQSYDNESQRYLDPQILETNGITKSGALKALGAVGGTFLQYQAQKAGAEAAASSYLNDNR